MERVASLFRGYEHLIFRFNEFLPPGYKMQPISIRHVGYLDRNIDAAAAGKLARGFIDRLCTRLAPYPDVLVKLLRAIDRFPSAEELPTPRTFDMLTKAGDPVGSAPVSGMTLQQAEVIRAAAAEVEALMSSLGPDKPADLMRELVLYLPTGLRHGLVDGLQGHTLYVPQYTN
jgi:hypothetical protein